MQQDYIFGTLNPKKFTKGGGFLEKFLEEKNIGTIYSQ
jgi:hypothetical protein